MPNTLSTSAPELFKCIRAMIITNTGAFQKHSRSAKFSAHKFEQ